MNNIYYNPENYGLEPFGELNEALSYEFNTLIVWRQLSTGKLFWASDEGCSCPEPFEDRNLENINPLVSETLDEFKKVVNDFPDTLEERQKLLKKVKDFLTQQKDG